MAAIGWGFLGDDRQLTDRLAALSHAELSAPTPTAVPG
jgi:hypothetical protein